MVKGKETIRKLAAGWDICCKWKDRFTLWEILFNLKALHPIQVAEVAVAHGIEDNPVFNWCVHHVLKKQDR